jgi:arylsulfatase A-like enzyme
MALLFVFVNTFALSLAAERPNIILLYADDLGYADVSCNAHAAKSSPSKPYFAHTPNIDTICKQGVYLNNYVTHHVCSPSRAGLLTGRHYTEVGSGVSIGGELDETVPNIAKDLQAHGYATAAFGKWHNGKAPHADTGKGGVPGLGVNAYGFDEWAGFYGGSQDYHTRVEKNEINWWTNDRQHMEDVEGYSTYILRDRAVDFIEKNAANPFFIYLSFPAVHVPYHILNTDLKEMCDLFDDKYPQLAWSNVSRVVSTDKDSNRTIGEVLQLRCSPNEEFDRQLIDRKLKGFSELVYYTMVYALDKGVGGVLSAVKKNGLSEKTIIAFASDNGATQSGNNGPFRGQKMTIWEGGIRVPSAIWWPRHLEAARKPYSPSDNRYPYLTQYIDLYPTLLGAAGQRVDAGAQLDGINLYDHLLNRSAARDNDQQAYYGLDDAWAAISNGRFKLHRNHIPGPERVEELYDLSADPGETTNLAQNPEFKNIRTTLEKRLDDWFASGEVTASYMKVPDAVDRKATARPEGEVLEVVATQDADIANPDDLGIYIRFSFPKWERSRDQFVHAGDLLEYDLHVAEDSDLVKGFFVSPSGLVPPRRELPLFDSKHGIGLNGDMIVEQVFEKGIWTRCCAGIGDVAPGKSLDFTIGLHSKTAGKYHFYIDNVVIRKPDGSVRAVVWENGEHTRPGSAWIQFKERYYGSFENLLSKNLSDLHFSKAVINKISL